MLFVSCATNQGWATLENATYNGGTAISVESQYYKIDNTKIVTPQPTGMPTYQNNNGITNNNPYSNTAANSASIYKLDATTNDVPSKTGLGIVLKVMAGDNINVFGKSYHKKPATGYTNATNPLSVTDIIGLFTSTSLISGKGITAATITGQSGFPTNVTTLLNNQTAQNSNLPRASINWIILDEQFKYVSGGFDMVGTATNTTGTFKNHTPTTISIPKNGYIYVYCSNESKYPVYFDNLQITHNRSPILEETSYYPFGLTMAGISSRAAGSLENKKKWNAGSELQNKEFSDGSGLEIYATNLRSLDPQLGRWWQIDPKPNNEESPYASMGNNPISKNDPMGDTARYKSADEALLWGARTLLNNKLNGLYEAQVTMVKDKLGYNYQVSIVKTKDYDAKKETSEIKEFVKDFNAIANGKEIVRQEIVMNDKNTVVGSWLTGKVDLADVFAFDRQKGGPSSLSVYMHEMKEQQEKAKLGLLPNQMGAVDKTGFPTQYPAPHQQGINAENRVSGTSRNESTSIFTDKAGNKIQVSLVPQADGSVIVTKTPIH